MPQLSIAILTYAVSGRSREGSLPGLVGQKTLRRDRGKRKRQRKKSGTGIWAKYEEEKQNHTKKHHQSVKEDQNIRHT